MRLKRLTSRRGIPGDPYARLIFTPMWTGMKDTMGETRKLAAIWRSTSSAIPA